MKGAAMNSTTTPTGTEVEETGDASHPQTQDSSEADLRLLVAFKPLQSRNDTIELTAEPVMVSSDADGREQVRTLLPGGFDGHPLADLKIRSLADHDPASSVTYPNSVEYRECYAVDLNRAEEIHTTLKRLHRALTRVEGELGPPESFTAYLARCAAALRIGTFGFRAGQSSGWHDSNAYQWTDPAGMVWRIHDHLSQWRSQPPR
jgi:hypothetical protein